MLAVNIFADQSNEGDQAVIHPSANQRKCIDEYPSSISNELQKRMKSLKFHQKHQVEKEKYTNPQIACSVSHSQLTISSIPKMIVNNGSSFTTRLPSTHLSQFKCPLCLHGYRSQTLLNDHMRKEHSVLI